MAAKVNPQGFSASDLFQNIGMQNQGDDITKYPIQFEFLHAAAKLRENGILTCILTNNWVNDQQNTKGKFSRGMFYLKLYFNEVIESAREGIRKPDTEIYKLTCKKLGVVPTEVVFLDDIGLNLKSASQLGIRCIKVTNTNTAIKELESAVQMKLTAPKDKTAFPPASHPDSVTHSYINVTPKVKLHFVEAGEGPAIILLHGFPDFWYGWRNQIPALVQAGYRVIVPDQRGFGESSCPPRIQDYGQKYLCDDVLKILDVLCIPQATVVGHDWGGSLAWNLALIYPDRFKAVCGINTPFFPINPKRNPMVSMMKNPGSFDYQLYFQEPGVAEKEFELDVERSLTLILKGLEKSEDDTIKKEKSGFWSTSNVRARGGMLVGAPSVAVRSPYLTDYDMRYYVKNFKRTGFRGPLNWYRNYELNWSWMKRFAGRKIIIPALMVTASHDLVLKPEYSVGMEKRIPLLSRLHIERCSHWTMQEQPYKLNCGLIKWLDEVHGKLPLVTSKI
uniref:bifunctional epoxide hydrolase 2-like n=1 Tax=Ciona intestinalis TaxID=7719 RepID=UPI000180BDB7|nr:bifunctional epoxide hydrolase 2-like [Ciona intestinalis]|eukprot:XP_026693760.1 bifunctional epoxide hydrolase 2-like [Ciona intestinalis]